LAKPARERHVTPNVALTIVLMIADNTVNLKISLTRSKALRPFANRSTRTAPIKPSSVFPIPIPIDVTKEPAVVRFEKKAPKKIPGQTRYPNTKKAASVKPAGGHTAVALGWT